MANFEAFHWNFSSTINLFFLKSELPNTYVNYNCNLEIIKSPKAFGDFQKLHFFLLSFIPGVFCLICPFHLFSLPQFVPNCLLIVPNCSLIAPNCSQLPLIDSLLPPIALQLPQITPNCPPIALNCPQLPLIAPIASFILSRVLSLNLATFSRNSFGHVY